MQIEEYRRVNKEQKEHIEILNKEIERLHSIIKEVREYIEKTKFKYCDDELCYMIENHYNRILEILDKDITKKSDYNYEKVEDNKE